MRLFARKRVTRGEILSPCGETVPYQRWVHDVRSRPEACFADARAARISSLPVPSARRIGTD